MYLVLAEMNLSIALAFCLAAPRAWNRLPTDLKLLRSSQQLQVCRQPVPCWWRGKTESHGHQFVDVSAAQRGRHTTKHIVQIMIGQNRHLKFFCNKNIPVSTQYYPTSHRMNVNVMLHICFFAVLDLSPITLCTNCGFLVDSSTEST